MVQKDKKIKIGALVSGNGTNLQSILDAMKRGVLKNIAQGVIVISNRPEAYALKRAQEAGVEALFLDSKLFGSRQEYFDMICQELEKREVDLICLAGFLLKLEGNIFKKFSERILNIHPALLPKFGGKGMYGHFVHEAVLNAEEKESGASVHLVDEEFDHGPVLLQRKVPVLGRDTAQVLADRVLKEEHILYPEAIRLYIQTKLKIPIA